jgi:hypothetical protein
MKILQDTFPANFAVAPANILTDVHDLDPINPPPQGARAQTTRVIVTDTHVTVAQDAPSGAQIIFNERHSFFEKSPKEADTAYIITESGKFLAFRKDTNCGCGSRLRSWNPYKTLNSIRDPKE